jgi:hypothetical protein
MDTSRKSSSIRANLPKLVYVGLTVFGVVFIWIAKTQAWSANFTIGVPVSLMAAYFLMSAFLAGFRLHDEQAGDNLYYMGFLFTLTSLGVSLYRFNTVDSIDGIVRNFGLAVVTTIGGIGFRILYNQVRRDPIDVERTARHELAEMTRRVRVELEAASREFSNFRRVSNQMLEEGFEEIGRQAERSGAQILTVMESLTQEAVKPIHSAGEHIKSVLDDVGVKMEGRLGGAAERMESMTKAFEDANAIMSKSVEVFSAQVETAGNKLAEIKTPDELVSIKLKPTLTVLEKVVTAHTEKLANSDDERAKQFLALQQTHQSIDKVVGAVERSVAAMEKAIESTAHSQRATENLSRMIQQQQGEIRQFIEKTAADRTIALARRVVDDGAALSGAVNASQEGVTMVPPLSLTGNSTFDFGPSEPIQNPQAEKARGWFSKR